MKKFFKIFLLMFCSFYISFSQNDTAQINKQKKAERMQLTIQMVKEKYTDSLMSLPGVEGVGIGKKGNKDCIFILTSEVSVKTKNKLPKELEGYPVKIQSIGKIHKVPKK